MWLVDTELGSLRLRLSGGGHVDRFQIHKEGEELADTKRHVTTLSTTKQNQQRRKTGRVAMCLPSLVHIVSWSIKQV